MEFSDVTILGAGLLGGSLALALDAQERPPAVRLWARRQGTVEEAENLGIRHITSDLKAAVDGAELVILAVPVGAMPCLVEAAIEAGLPENCLITDVGSVKSNPHRAIAPLLSGNRRFIGSHPMAGSERNGLAAVTQHLFQGAACLLTNDEGVPAPIAAALENFWRSVGCRTTWMSSAIHDELVARISHLPHLLAASGARVCLKDPSEGRFGGGGLKDTTRVAAGSPSMWAEIVMENREAILPPLREAIADLNELLSSIEDADQQKIQHWLAIGKRRRDAISPIR